MYEALVSFATKIISMFKGQVAEIDDPEIVEDLLAAKYIEAYSPRPSGGGWDAGIEFDLDTDPQNPTAQFIFGSRDVLMEKVESERTPMVFFKFGTTLRADIYGIEKNFDDPDELVMNVGTTDYPIQCLIKADGSIDVSL